MGMIGHRQEMKLLQKLSPQQIQMIKLLELPAILLEQRVKQEIEENPLLEEEIEEHSLADTAGGGEFDINDYKNEDDIPSYKLNIRNSSDDSHREGMPLAGGKSFQEYLDEQLGFKSLSDKEYTLAKFIVGSLDSDGYLRRELESIVDDVAFGFGLEVSVDDVESALRTVQELEPAGVGARDLQECLLIQLAGMDDADPTKRLATTIVRDHFYEFTRKHYDKLEAKLGVPPDEFRLAMDEILHLNPKPANTYSDMGTDAAPQITPDFILDYHNGEFELSMNSMGVPELRINRSYVRMAEEIASQGKSQTDGDKEALQFVRQRLESARTFISALEQRQNTLMATMTEILKFQQAYFEDGDESKLRPMILKDIADATGLDVSTISRVVNSKYIQTHFGIFLLKYFFSEGLLNDSGEEVSSREIKRLIAEFIDAEDKLKPLTDEAILSILKDRGFQMARRTVAKYREMLGIPVARLRKEL